MYLFFTRGFKKRRVPQNKVCENLRFLNPRYLRGNFTETEQLMRFSTYFAARFAHEEIKITAFVRLRYVLDV